ncbi:unnamed protein product [Brassicogethes aeneus]|uniref:Sodium channel protein Nach n=1 Tax=Brassicogethes aeneus TaxID=1431903 RepID=A0A9P0B5K7_BRAAE|nr:unnamed protein product [Brassicogethes aeneus]
MTRFTQNPTVISMERDHFSWNTSFPAATICPSNRFDEEKLDAYVEKSSAKNKTYLKLFLQSLSEATYTNFENVLPYYDIPASEFLNILMEIQFTFKPYVTNSGLTGSQYNLTQIMSEMGICYSYNSELAIYNSPGTECRINMANRLCGCVPHFYRQLASDKVCNVSGLHCLSRYKEQLIQGNCQCIANCDEVNYFVEEFDTREWFLGSNLQWGLKYPKMRLKRNVIFGFSDFLVYIGGIAGLFLGCSVLSFIEIVYFFTLRLYWFIVKYHHHHQGRN